MLAAMPAAMRKMVNLLVTLSQLPACLPGRLSDRLTQDVQPVCYAESAAAQ
jgi:hypothetical protein